ncbi:MAG: transposase [Bradyrhizobium sp.]
MAHRYRLYPTPEQETICARHCNDTRFIWNLVLEQFNHFDRRVAGQKPPSFAERGRQLPEIRRGTWLAEGSSSIQKEAMRDFERACRNWWRGSHRRPNWRKVGKHESFCIRDVSIRKLSGRWATVRVPKCGAVRFRLSRPLPPDFGMGRVTKDAAGRWHVAFAAPQPAIERSTTGKEIGLDLGIAVSVATSDGLQLCAPQPGAPEFKRKLRLERKLARQSKGSNRRARTKLALAKLAARQADRLNDWREKVTTQLVIENDLIVIENLKVKNMMRSAKGSIEAPGKNVRAKSGLNREIARQGWSTFALRLEQKAAAAGVEVIRVPAPYTSLCCNACGHTVLENRKNQAAFLCQVCGHQANADVNAAKNILATGLEVTGRGGIVRPIGPVVPIGGPGETSITEAARCAA